MNYCNIQQRGRRKIGSQDIPIFLKLWFLRRYREVSIVLGLNILALGICVFNMTYGTDDYIHLLKGCDMVSWGRWVSHIIYNYLCMQNYLPVLSQLVGITAMVLTGFELTRLWCIRNFINRVLIMAFFSLYPYVLEMYNFRTITAVYPWAYYLALLALNQRKGWIAAILFCISLGVYQTALGFAVCAWLMALLFRLHANGYRFNKTLLRWHFKGWGWIILGLIGYFLILKMTLVEGQMNSNISAGFFSLDALSYLKYLSILFVCLSFIPEYVIPLVPKIGVFLCVVLGTGIILVESKLRWWVVLIIVILPFAAIAHVLPLAYTYVPWRVSFGLIVLVTGLFAMILQHKKMHKTGLWLGLFLIVSFIIVDNARMFEQYIRNQRDMAMANRIACRIQSLQGYTPGMKLVVVGDTSPIPVSWWKGKFTIQAIKDLFLYYSQKRYTLEGSFEKPWSKYEIFINYLQLPLTLGSAEAEKTARQFIQVHGCRPWPHPSSVFIIDDTVVLFLDPS